MDDLIIVDRIEGTEAVCEVGGGSLVLPLHLLPQGVREGDVLVQSDTGWTVDRAATEARRNASGDRYRHLFPRKP